MKLKDKLSTYWRQTALVVAATAVFCYWMLLFPYILLMREGAQLFVFTSEYFLERLMLPGGIAQYVAEFIVQFFFFVTFGSIFYALLFVLFHWLTSKLLRKYVMSIGDNWRYVLSFIPGIIMVWVGTVPTIPLTPTISVLIVMVCMLLIPDGKKWRVVTTCVAVPLLFWIAGPAVVLVLLCCVRWIPLTAVVLVASVVGSSYFVPYPLKKIATGIDYVWTGENKLLGTFEEMECDVLIRTRQWHKIIDKFGTPKSPAVRSAVLLAFYQTKQMDAQEFYSKMMIPFEMMRYEPSVFNMSGPFLKTRFGTLVSAYMLSDIAFHMNMPMVSMRTTFEAMEFIPNYNKSGRSMRRLVETNIITGNYEVALKYISTLERTLFYRSWARRMRQLAEHPEKIKDNYFYRNSQDAFKDSKEMFFV
jgi:hypothetical protein